LHWEYGQIFAEPEIPHTKVDETGLASNPTTVTARDASSAESENTNQPKRVLGFRDLLLFYVVTGVSLRWIATAAAA